MGLDAISTPKTVDEIPFKGRTYWAINGNEADASTAIEVKTAPGAGKTLFITSVLITCDDDDADPVLQDEDDNLLFGPFYAKVAGPIVVNKDFKRPIQLVTNKALEVKAAAGGTFSIWIEGATAEV